MRHATLAIVMILLGSLPASAQFGPPQPRAGDDGYSLGVGLHNVMSRWTPYDVDVSRNRIYLEGSCSLSECVELFGRVGGSNLVFNDVETWRPGLVRDVSTNGLPAFLSGGIRGTLWRWGECTIGASLEAAVYSGFEKTIRWNFDTFQELFFDETFEINASLSVGYPLGRGIVYAGPLLHFGYARADVRTHTFGANWSIVDSIDALTVRDKAGVGAFVGWQTPIGDNGWHLELEGSTLRDGVGGAIGFFKRW